ncbi:MAG: DUF1028 domain-containing protein [Anaerolineae bacterium]|nr:DUF1028 domain-containing protein [Anaerolineae bacterium]
MTYSVWRLRTRVVLSALLALSLPGWFRTLAADQDGQTSSTWSIVAADPTTGDVGIALASCVPMYADAVAALVPGKGAAAVQANVDLGNRNRVFDLLQAGRPADEIVAEVTRPANDAQSGARQYGVVTLTGGVKVAAYTGAQNSPSAGHRSNADRAVTVQGNLLASMDVVERALAAFNAPDIGAVALSDRLVRALEAGSAAGGDRRCNTGGVQQTASTAFIMVARADQGPFAVPNMGETRPSDPNAPWLYLSVLEPMGGPNPLLALRQGYDAWRVAHLPPCPTCDLRPIPVPLGGRPTDPARGSPPPLSQAATRTAPTPVPTSRPGSGAATPRPFASPTPILPPINPTRFTQTLLLTLACAVALMVGLSLLLTTAVRRLWRRR